MFEYFIQDLLVINIVLDKGTWRMGKYMDQFIGAMVRRRYDRI